MKQNIFPFLGRCFSDKEVAAYLGVEVRIVRKYYEMLGGFRLGKKYVFLEKGLRDALQAKIRGLDGGGHGVGGEETAPLQDSKSCPGMGDCGAEKRVAEVEFISFPW